MQLYILTAKILTTHIRMNPNIRGLKTPDKQHEVKLSNTFKCLNDYERASGAKINRDNCTGLWSGSMKR